METYLKSVETAFRERQSTIILALTGRTGSGCSTVANILKAPKFSDLHTRLPKNRDFDSRDARKYEVIYKYMQVEDRWKKFTIIEGSSVIFSFILELGYEQLLKYFEGFKNVDDNNDIRISSYNDLRKILEGLNYLFDKSEYCSLKNLENILNDSEEVTKYYKFYVEDLPKLKQEFYDALKNFTCHKEYVDRFSKPQFAKSHLYTFFMQQVGNNIRKSGSPYSKEYSEESFYSVAEKIDNIIKIIKKHHENIGENQTKICIDAIRNPYEAYFFKDRYSCFYLVSINCEESDRKKRLGKLDEEELKSLDRIEYEDANNDDYGTFYHQDMQNCLAISDIHLYNPQIENNKYYFLTEQILKYISLMLHPGLITPTHIERCMQTAYVARLNSGCLSRQVGAVITGEDYSIKAIGWNEVPEGQVPCNLRCVDDYCTNKDIETYSSYELDNLNFQKALEEINSKLKSSDTRGLSYAYCFKDIYNSLTNNKNQVFTRALHAEENAFLQLSKNGGQGIKGGKLFTTASPCELCAKKAFQLGIQEIYYIDPYPGISVKHILKFGTKFSPSMNLFYGAIGDAYIRLYVPRFALKDELKLLTGIENKKIVKEIEYGNIHSAKPTDIKYTRLENMFVFKTRTNIMEKTAYELEALHDDIDKISQQIYWTGSSFNGIKILSCSREYTFINIDRIKLPYVSELILKDPLKKGDKLAIEMQVDAKDSQLIMSPYYAQLMSIRTDFLDIGITAPKGLLQNVRLVTYADLGMSKNLIVDTESLEAVFDNGNEIYRKEIDKPNLMYSYCIEWTFGDVKENESLD